jgi:hypothetical protein
LLNGFTRWSKYYAELSQTIKEKPKNQTHVSSETLQLLLQELQLLPKPQDAAATLPDSATAAAPFWGNIWGPLGNDDRHPSGSMR